MTDDTTTTIPRKWALAVSPTRSETWTTITDWEFDTEQEAFAEAPRWLDDHLVQDDDGTFYWDDTVYFATWQEDDDHVTTILSSSEVAS